MSYRSNYQVLEPVPGPVPARGTDNYSLNKSGNFLAWLIGLTILFWLILWFLWKPTWIQNKDANGVPTGQLNPWLALIWAFILALIISAIIYWLFNRK